MVEERAERRLWALLAADVASYCGLVEADEAATLAPFKGHLGDGGDTLAAARKPRWRIPAIAASVAVIAAAALGVTTMRSRRSTGITHT